MADSILDEAKARWATRLALLPAATQDTHDVAWLISQLELHELLDGVGDGEWRQRAKKFEARAERYWGDLCEVVRLLGKVASSRAPEILPRVHGADRTVPPRRGQR